jgi:hypothetical protein
MTKHDKAALELAIESCKAEGDGRAEQIDSMLSGVRYEDRSIGKWANPPRPWAEVARFAAICCQTRALRLAPYEMAPCQADRDPPGPPSRGSGWAGSYPQARALLDRMLKAGVSQWHPDPLAALEAAK